MKDKISIIVPIYNSERYLSECINSLINQSHKNIEILLINDGSTDSSINILSNFNDKRIKIFNRTNFGVSETRNFGIDMSTGDYITFVDSDDFVDVTFIEKLFSTLNENDADLGACGYSYLYQNDEVKTNYTLSGKISNESTKMEILKNDFNSIRGFSCNKIFKSKIIKDNNIRFDPEIFLWEDVVFLFEYLKYSNNTFILNEPLYKYRMRQSSASNKISNKSLSIFLALNKLSKLDLKFNDYALNSIYYSYFKYYHILGKHKSEYGYVKKLSIRSLLFNKHIQKKTKFICLCNYFIPERIKIILRKFKNNKYSYFK